MQSGAPLDSRHQKASAVTAQGRTSGAALMRRAGEQGPGRSGGAAAEAGRALGLGVRAERWASGAGGWGLGAGGWVSADQAAQGAGGWALRWRWLHGRTGGGRSTVIT